MNGAIDDVGTKVLSSAANAQERAALASCDSRVRASGVSRFRVGARVRGDLRLAIFESPLTLTLDEPLAAEPTIEGRRTVEHFVLSPR
jgi:hypothetical protein